jgi:hypothetical protein
MFRFLTVIFGTVSRSLWTKLHFKQRSLETVCRELASDTTDPVERAALLEIADTYRKAAQP